MIRIALIIAALASVSVAQPPLVVGTFDYDGALIISVETSASLPDWTRPVHPQPAIAPPPVAVPGRVLYSNPQPVRQAVQQMFTIQQRVQPRYVAPQVNVDNCVGGT